MKFLIAAHDQSFETTPGNYWTWKHPALSRNVLDKLYYDVVCRNLPRDPGQLRSTDLHGGVCSIDSDWICYYRIVDGGRDLKNRPGRIVLIAAFASRHEAAGRNALGVLNHSMISQVVHTAATRCPLPGPPTLEIDFGAPVAVQPPGAPAPGVEMAFSASGDPIGDAVAAGVHTAPGYRFDCRLARRSGFATATLKVERLGTAGVMFLSPVRPPTQPLAVQGETKIPGRDGNAAPQGGQSNQGLNIGIFARIVAGMAVVTLGVLVFRNLNSGRESRIVPESQSIEKLPKNSMHATQPTEPARLSPAGDSGVDNDPPKVPTKETGSVVGSAKSSPPIPEATHRTVLNEYSENVKKNLDLLNEELKRELWRPSENGTQRSEKRGEELKDWIKNARDKSKQADKEGWKLKFDGYPNAEAFYKDQIERVAQENLAKLRRMVLSSVKQQLTVDNKADNRLQKVQQAAWKIAWQIEASLKDEH